MEIGNQAQSTVSARPNSVSTMATDRMRILIRIITRQRYDCCLPALETNDLLACAGSWSEGLSNIPDCWLNACYSLAIWEHSARGPFSISEIVEAWLDVQAGDDYKRWRERELRSSQGRCEHGCDGGWIFVDRTGDKGGVRPCPIHRAALSGRIEGEDWAGQSQRLRDRGQSDPATRAA